MSIEPALIERDYYAHHAGRKKRKHLRSENFVIYYPKNGATFHAVVAGITLEDACSRFDRENEPLKCHRPANASPQGDGGFAGGSHAGWADYVAAREARIAPEEVETDFDRGYVAGYRLGEKGRRP